MNPFLTLSLQLTAITVRGISDEIEMNMGVASCFLVKQGIPAKQIKTLESEDIKVICLEVNIAKRKWAIFNIYRPSFKSIDHFFNELTKLIDLAINKYKNVVVMGDFNIDISDSSCHGYHRLEQFPDIFSLQHLIKSTTCIIKTSESTIDSHIDKS